VRSHDRARIGLVEDDPIMGESIAHRLDLEGYEVDWWQTGEAALRGVQAEAPDLLICDIRLPDINGESLFDRLLPKHPGMPVLFITGFAQVDQAVRLMRAGAADYVVKPFAIQEFLAKIETLTRNAHDEVSPLGKSDAMRRIDELLRRVVGIDSTVLFTGESGVGKEVAARYLHKLSPRADSPFIAVNCAAIPRDLLESELFGHERGSFTGAVARHHGYVERAAGGILFLDEIGELPLALQSKLLRLLESRHFQRIGGETELISDARIVCATNTDLAGAVARGAFRQDLLFRIQVIGVAIPPLRERCDDIEPLLNDYRQQFAAAFGRHIAGYTPSAIRVALTHSWPGNAREIRNRVERAVALADGPWITPENLFPDVWKEAAEESELSSLAHVREQVERHHIKSALERANGKVDDAARMIGVSRSTLFDKIRRLGISIAENGA
jgi:two-component system, NtrC family, response regulator HydG